MVFAQIIDFLSSESCNMLAPGGVMVCACLMVVLQIALVAIYQFFRFGWLAGKGALQNYVYNYIREPQTILLAYLDDFLASLGDSDRLIEWSRHVRALFGTLGIEFKERKCQWTPVQCKQHLGILIDTQ